jgi:hypothetical protein
LTIEWGTADDLPLGADSLDALMTVNTVYFLPDLLPAFREFTRVLRRSGRAVVCLGDPTEMAGLPVTAYWLTGGRPRSISRTCVGTASTWLGRSPTNWSSLSVVVCSLQPGLSPVHDLSARAVARLVGAQAFHVAARHCPVTNVLNGHGVAQFPHLARSLVDDPFDPSANLCLGPAALRHLSADLQATVASLVIQSRSYLRTALDANRFPWLEI